MRPRAPEWDIDFGEPLSVCKETGEGTGVYERKWSRATVQWDCESAHGKITASSGPVPVDIYLATTGSDDNDGSSLAKALASVHAAQLAVRAALSTPGQKAVTVWIGPGEWLLRSMSLLSLIRQPFDKATLLHRAIKSLYIYISCHSTLLYSSVKRMFWRSSYVLGQPLNLSMADSGRGRSTVAWKALRTGTAAKRLVAPVTFSGGQSVQFVADSASGLWAANVSGLPAKAVAYGRQLWVNDRRAQRSREPGSYMCEKTSTSPCSRSKTLWGDNAWEITNETVRIVDAQAAARAKRWPNAGAGVEFVWTGVESAAWAESRCQVKRVMDAQNGTVELQMAQRCLSCFVKFWGTRLGHQAPAPTAIEAIGNEQLNPGEW